MEASIGPQGTYVRPKLTYGDIKTLRGPLSDFLGSKGQCWVDFDRNREIDDFDTIFQNRNREKIDI